MNELRDPHEPVIPGQHEHPTEGHGGVSMPIGVSGQALQGSESYEAMQRRVEGELQARAANGSLDLVDMTDKLDKQLAETAEQAEPNEDTDEQS